MASPAESHSSVGGGQAAETLPSGPAPLDTLRSVALFAAQCGYAADIVPLATASKDLYEDDALWSRLASVHLGHTKVVTMLMAAVNCNHEARAMWLLRCLEGLPVPQKELDKCLRLACTNGNRTLIGSLLARGADPRAKDSGGWTPVHAAAQGGHWEPIIELATYGADVNARTTKDGFSALDLAIISKHEACALCLVQIGASIDPSAEGRHDVNTPLYLAAERGLMCLVSLLLGRGIHPDTGAPALRYSVKTSCHGSKAGELPLHAAARQGHVEVVALLLSAGARPRLKTITTYEQSALHLACWWGHEAVARVLLEAGANVNSQDKKGERPLDTLQKSPNHKTRSMFDLLKAYGGRFSKHLG